MPWANSGHSLVSAYDKVTDINMNTFQSGSKLDFVHQAGKQSAYGKGLNLRDGLLLHSRYGGSVTK